MNVRNNSLNITIVHCDSVKVPDIESMLIRLGCSLVIVRLEGANEFDFSTSDGVVISGGPKLFTDANQFVKLKIQFEFISRIKVPVLGICLGHQAIGLTYGSSVFRDSERRDTESIKQENKNRLFWGIDGQFEVATDHCEGISLPKDFELLASSDYYANEAMANKKKKLYGVQFHPEVSGNVGEQIFGNFCHIVSEDKATSG